VIRTVGEFVDAVNALLESGALTRDMPVKCVWDGCSWPVQAVAAEPITVNRSKLVRKLIPHGRFAAQDSGQYAATSTAPTARTLALAAAVIKGRVPDFVEHAVQWDAPAVQDRNHERYLREPERFPQYRYSSADIARRRTEAGAREVRVPGVPATRFWSYSQV